MSVSGVFRLIDPPPGQAAVIEAAIAAIDYPWQRLASALADDKDGAVLVKWTPGDPRSGASGLFLRYTYEIVLADYLGPDAAFVFAHEVGHLVDRATFDTATRDALSALFHRGPYTSVIGGYTHDHPEIAGHASERWGDYTQPWHSRLDESYADQFVAAFAPRLWRGDPSVGWYPTYPRAIHWTDDHAAIRCLTLVRDLTPPKPTPAPEPTLPTLEKPMNLITRAEWGAAYAKGSGAIPGPVLGVTCHWEGPHMGDFPHSVCARKVRSIERYHAVNRGWSGIAYNLLVCPHGDVFEGRGHGVRSAANGISGIGGNDRWYAVCYLGGVGDPFTRPGRQGFNDAIAYLRQHGAGWQVNGHRDHHATECPGDAIYAWAHGNHTDTTSPEEDDMPTADEIAKATVKELKANGFPNVEGGKDATLRFDRMLSQVHNRTGDTRERLGRANDYLRALLARDATALADAVAAKVNVSVNADAEVVKQAVKDALAEGVA